MIKIKVNFHLKKFFCKSLKIKNLPTVWKYSFPYCPEQCFETGVQTHADPHQFPRLQLSLNVINKLNFKYLVSIFSEVLDKNGLVEVIYTEIYTDVSEAFNRVQHDILLHKPSNYGLNEGVININWWIHIGPNVIILLVIMKTVWSLTFHLPVYRRYQILDSFYSYCLLMTYCWLTMEDFVLLKTKLFAIIKNFVDCVNI